MYIFKAFKKCNKNGNEKLINRNVFVYITDLNEKSILKERIFKSFFLLRFPNYLVEYLYYFSIFLKDVQSN